MGPWGSGRALTHPPPDARNATVGFTLLDPDAFNITTGVAYHPPVRGHVWELQSILSLTVAADGLASGAGSEVQVAIPPQPSAYQVQVTPGWHCAGGWWVPTERKVNSSFVVMFACTPPAGATFDLAVSSQPYRGNPRSCTPGERGFYDGC